jgi:uncharacterized protein (DUF2237 family)
MTDKTSTGYCSTGNHSISNYSTGHFSTGYFSTGNHSTGNFSTGYCSTGYCSTGDHSTGDHSTGNHSTGDFSTGNHSTGDFSISDYSTGHFSTEDYSGFGAFNKPCTLEEWENAKKPELLKLVMTEWIPQYAMTSTEKEENLEYETTGGYLRVYSYKEAWRNSWDNATDEDKELLYALPNFDKEVFKEISGIDLDEDTVKELTIAELEEKLGYKIKVIRDRW